jgi:hypothetical protein
MLFPYYADVTFNPGTPGKVCALVHPGGAQTGPIYFRAFDIVSGADGLIRVRLMRHPSKATGGSTNDAYSFADGAPSSFAQVLGGDVSFPNDTANLSLIAHTLTRSSGGGLVFPTNNASNGAITILSDHSLVFETLDHDRRGDYTIRLFWGEPAPLIPHLTTVLPDSGAYTTGTYFDIPLGITQLTFAGTYTAANPSSGARPKMRVSWGRGASTGFVQPIRDATLNISSLPVASRATYLDELEYPTPIVQGVTVQFAVAYDVLPGMNKVRLDVAELGAISTPGSIVVGVTGSG